MPLDDAVFSLRLGWKNDDADASRRINLKSAA